MKIVGDDGNELDSEVSIGSDENLYGIFLEARGGKLGLGAKNPDYFVALELILKRLYYLNIQNIRIFRSSLQRPYSTWAIEDREIFLNDSKEIKLSAEFYKLRQEICTAISKFKINPKTKGGNPTKRIFISTDAQFSEWDAVVYGVVDKKFLQNDEQNDNAQDEIIIDIISKNKSREILVNELLELSKVETSKVLISGETYQRNNQAIARIKILRNFKCQLCGTSIQKKNGLFYVEAAHIDPKRLNGKETLENIILLCPNHHKEFDLGDLKILYRSNELFKFLLNNKFYSIDLKV